MKYNRRLFKRSIAAFGAAVLFMSCFGLFVIEDDVNAAFSAPEIKFDSSNGLGYGNDDDVSTDDIDLLASLTYEVDESSKEVRLRLYNYVPGVTPRRIKIPTEFYADGDVYTVTEIGDDAFGGCELTEISFADDCQIRTIGARAFASNYIEKFSDLPASVKLLGESCFAGNSALKVLDLSTSSLTAIPYSCFDTCTSLNDVTLPEGLLEIGADAFYGNKALNYVKIPPSVERIGILAFRNCKDDIVINLDGISPGDITGAPWGAPNGYVLWDKSTGYNNDSPFVVGDDGLIYGLKTGRWYDTENDTLQSVSNYKTNKDDYRYYAWQSEQYDAHTPFKDKSWTYNERILLTESHIKGKSSYKEDVFELVTDDSSSLSKKADMGTVTYKGRTYDYPVKMNSHPSLKFTPKYDGMLVLVFGDNSTKDATAASEIEISHDGDTEIVSLTEDSMGTTNSTVCPVRYVEYRVSAGVSYTMKRHANEAELFAAEIYYDYLDPINFSTSEEFDIDGYVDAGMGDYKNGIFEMTGGSSLKSNWGSVLYKGRLYDKAFKFRSGMELNITPKEDGVLRIVTVDTYNRIYFGSDGYFSPDETPACEAYIFSQPTVSSGSTPHLNTYTIDVVAGKTYTWEWNNENNVFAVDVLYDSDIGSSSVLEGYDCISPVGSLSNVNNSTGENEAKNVRVSIKPPKKVQKVSKDGQLLDEWIDIKGIAEGAFGSQPANQVISNADFLDLEGVMTEIPEAAFWEDEVLKTVINIPDSVIEIKKNAFRKCNDLTEITLPSYLSTVDYWAFRECTQLTTVRITPGKFAAPNAEDMPIVQFDTGAFSRCPRLKDVYALGATEATMNSVRGIADEDEGIDETGTLSYPFGAWYADFHLKDGNVLAYTIQAEDDPETSEDESLWMFNRVTGDAVFYNGPVQGKDLIIPRTLTWKDTDGSTYDVPITGVGQKDDNMELLWWNTTGSTSGKKWTEGSANGKEIGRVILNDQIEYINDSVFYRIKIGECDFSVATSLREIAYRAFGAASGAGFTIGKVVFPDSLEVIEDLAFEYRNFTSQPLVEIAQSSEEGSDTREVGELVIPKFMRDIAVGAFEGATGIGKILIKQYYYNESDPDYETVADQYMQSPVNVSSRTPYGINTDAYAWTSPAGPYVVRTEYMDDDLPMFSDYITGEKLIKAKPAGVIGSGGWSQVNEAVMNVGVIMPNSAASVVYIGIPGRGTDEAVSGKNDEWWINDLGVAVKQHQRIEDGGTLDPDDTVNSHYDGSRQYQFDISGIKGNGDLTMAARYLPQGKAEFSHALHDVPINIFHKQFYNANGGDNAPVSVIGHKDADADVEAADTGNVFVETFGVPVLGPCSMSKKKSLFLGWYVVEADADDVMKAPDKILRTLNDDAAYSELLSDPDFIKYDDGETMFDTEVSDFVSTNGVKAKRLAMGTTDRTLFAVWAVDDDGDGVADLTENSDLSLTKKVISRYNEDLSLDFNFEITLTGKNSDGLEELLTGNYDYEKYSSDGTLSNSGTLDFNDAEISGDSVIIKVQLKADERYVIKKLPHRTEFNITEKDVSPAKFRVTNDGALNSAINDDVDVTVTNNRIIDEFELPDTGGTGLPFGVGVGFITGLFVAFVCVGVNPKKKSK